MYFIFELFVASIITYFFIKREKPKIRFLFYGILFYLISLLLQLPFIYVQSIFKEYFSQSTIPIFILTIILTIISVLTRYFSLKKYLKTKSFKNGILFGIGWSTFQSINFLKITFLTLLFSHLSLSFDSTFMLSKNLSFLNFSYFFITNLAITTLIILTVIKKNKLYTLYAILLNLLICLGLLYLKETHKIIFLTLSLMYCLFIIFYYKKI